MSEPLDIQTLRAVAGITGLLLAGIALRVERYGHRITRIEAKLENGLTHAVEQVEKDVETLKGAEARILRWCDENLRERRGPPRRR